MSDTAPATPASDSQLSSVSDTILAEARAQAAGAPVPTSSSPAPVATAPEKKPAINIDPATLKEITKLQKQNRELAAKAKEAESAAAAKAKLDEIQALLAAGKKVEAFAKLAGSDKDPTDTLTEALQEYLANGPDVDENPLESEVKNLRKRLDEEDEAKKKSAAKEAEAAREAAVRTARDFAIKRIDPAKYSISAKAENKDEAAQAALDGVVYLAGQRNIDLDKATEDDVTKLFDEVLPKVEAQFEELGKRYSKGSSSPAPQTSYEPPTRAGVATRPVKPTMTLEELLEESRAMAVWR